MKVFRILGLTVLGIVALLVAAVVIASFVVDPNTYKPQIESAVESSTRLDLTLAGDIDWSLLPLGLTLKDVSADLDGELFARLDNLVAEVNLWSLLRLEPQVDTFILEGMTANLIRDEQGQGNWERIMPDQAASPADAPTQPTEEPAPATPAEEAAGDTPAEPLQFEISEVRIADAELHYADRATGQEVVLDRVNFNAQDITLGSTFPVDLSFHFATSQPPLDVVGNLSAAVTASEDLQRFALAGLDSNFEIQGEPVGNETVEASFAGDINVDLEAETASLAGFRAQLMDLVLRSELNVKGFGEASQVSGNLAIEPFSARQLLAKMGQEPETQDPNVLQKVALETDIGGPAGQIQLNNFVLTLDDTQFKGQLGYGLADTAITVDLQGNKLNLDRYLPPPSEDPAAAEQAPDQPAEDAPQTATSEKPAASSAAEADLLPLETIRGLVFDIRLGLDELIAKNLKINAIEFNATGEDGLINIDPIKGNLYNGDFLVTARLDARQDNPQWQISQRLNNIETLPLLTDLAEIEMLSGKVNMRADIQTQGNQITALRENASGEASFNIDEGAFESTNLTAYACEGIALINGESIDTSNWPPRTPFNDLSGVMQVDGNILTNNNLSAALGGLDLDGEGTIDLAKMMLDYELGLKVVGAVHKDNACRVNERVQNIAIPLECRGSLESPEGLCSFDGSRFRDTIKDMAKAEAREKVTEEVDRALDKQLDKFLGDEEDGDTRKQLKDTLKGLFN